MRTLIMVERLEEDTIFNFLLDLDNVKREGSKFYGCFEYDDEDEKIWEEIRILDTEVQIMNTVNGYFNHEMNWIPYKMIEKLHVCIHSTIYSVINFKFRNHMVIIEEVLPQEMGDFFKPYDKEYKEQDELDY